MMHAEPKLSVSLPPRWEGHVSLTPLDAGVIVSYLPRHVAIRRSLQVTAAVAAAKAKELNELPGAL
jgi:hypothetical protein